MDRHEEESESEAEMEEEDDEDEIPLEMEDIEAVSKKARQDEDLNTEHLQVGLQCWDETPNKIGLNLFRLGPCFSRTDWQLFDTYFAKYSDRK